MIICDTREKKNQHVLEYLDRHGIPYTVQKLETGDYMDSDRPTMTIDRKRNLDELCTNLCSPDSSRFWREVRRSKAERIRMIVLIEHGGGIHSIKDVAGWRSKYSRVTGRRLMAEIYRCHISYGVEFLFCSKRSTGKRIVELLHGNTRMDKATQEVNGERTVF